MSLSSCPACFWPGTKGSPRRNAAANSVGVHLSSELCESSQHNPGKKNDGHDADHRAQEWMPSRKSTAIPDNGQRNACDRRKEPAKVTQAVQQVLGHAISEKGNDQPGRPQNQHPRAAARTCVPACRGVVRLLALC